MVYGCITCSSELVQLVLVCLRGLDHLAECRGLFSVLERERVCMCVCLLESLGRGPGAEGVLDSVLERLIR